MAFLMERNDHSKVMMRSVARELLATCVMRPLMGLATPYNINKAGFLCSQRFQTEGDGALKR